MGKRIISVLLMISLVLSGQSISVFAEEATDISEVIESESTVFEEESINEAESSIVESLEVEEDDNHADIKDIVDIIEKKYVKFDSNTDSDTITGMPEDIEVISDKEITLSSDEPVRDGYLFITWNTKPDGTGTFYDAGSTLTTNSDVVLYAMWVPTSEYIDESNPEIEESEDISLESSNDSSERSIYVRNRINNYVSSLGGTYSTNYMNKAYTCCAFVNYTWKGAFGFDMYSGKCTNQESSYTSTSQFISFLDTYATPGDILYGKRDGYGQHWIIILGWDNNGITISDGKGSGAVWHNAKYLPYSGNSTAGWAEWKYYVDNYFLNGYMLLKHMNSNAITSYSKPPVIDSYGLASKDETTGTYTVQATITSEAGLSRVQFPTWTNYNDQDDIQPNWSTNSAASGNITYLGSNKYKVTYTVYTSSHNNEQGYYNTDMYVYDKDGNSVSATCRGIDMTKGPSISSYRIYNLDLVNGSYCVEAFVVNASKVQFPSWTEKNGKDDLPSNWSTSSAYSGTKIDDYRWTYKVKSTDHNNERGNYITQIYAYDAQGRKSSIQVSVVNLTAETSGTWGTSNPISWSFSDDGVLTISGTGIMEESKNSTEDSYDNLYGDYPWRGIIKKVKKIVINEGITGISSGAFSLASSLTEVEFPSTMKKIGYCAFADCTSLSGDIILPANCEVYGSAFGNTNITDIYMSGNIPSSVCSINNGPYNIEYSTVLAGSANPNDPTIVEEDHSGVKVEWERQTNISFIKFYYKEQGFYINGHNYLTFFYSRKYSTGTFPEDAVIHYPRIWEKDSDWNNAEYGYNSDTGLLWGFNCVPYDNVSSINVDKHLGSTKEVPVNGIILSDSSIVLNVGDSSKKLTATLQPEDTTDTSVEWYSADTSIATVDADGNVTPVGEGSTTIFACAGGITPEMEEKFGLVASCQVTVNDNSSEKSAEFVEDSIIVSEGDQVELKYTVTGNVILTFSSDDESVATVNDSGIVNAISSGYTSIKMSYNTPDGLKTKICTVTVNGKAKQIKLDKEEVVLSMGEKVQLVATVIPNNAEIKTVNWSSDSPSVVVVNEEGVITAVSEGTAIITATSADVASVAKAECSITVKNAEGVNADVSKIRTKVGNDEATSEVLRGIWVSGIEDKEYTGKNITQDIKVYDGYKLLKEKVDYTVSYGNNKNAADSSDEKAPYVQITMKGNYKEKQRINFSILPVDISTNSNINVNSIVLAPKNNAQYAVPTIKFGNIGLKNHTDFELQYVGRNTEGAFKEEGTYKINIVALDKNYTGTLTVDEIITSKKNMATARVAAVKNQEYKGSPICPKPSITCAGIPGSLVEGEDFEYEYVNNNAVGTATIRIVAKEGSQLAGVKIVTFKITGANLSKAIISNVPMKVKYTGNAITIPEASLVYEGKTLVENKDYTVTYQKNTDKGTATMLFTGIGEYTGPKKKTFVIETKSLKDSDIEASVSASTYQKDSSKPDVTVKMGSKILVEGKDYTVNCKNNRNITNGEATATATIIGKGNYKDSLVFNYEIKKQNISNTTITVADKKYSKAKSGYVSKPVIKDLNGKALKEKTDYTLSYKIYSKDEYGVPAAGSSVLVTAIGCGNYEGSISESYAIYNNSISAATLKIQDQVYTGNAITITEDDIIEAYTGAGKNRTSLYMYYDYEIVSFTNNIKAGKGSVTIKGVGEYGGTKVIKYNILKKDIVANYSGSF